MNSSLPIEWLTLTKLVNFIFLEIPDPCSPNPCENEGRCKAELNTFECECVPGFKGKTCKGTLIGLKLNSYCDSFAITILRRLKKNLFFTKILLLFSEKTPCGRVVSPCKNGGTCLEDKDDFRCICSREWKGKDCSESKTVVDTNFSVKYTPTIVFHLCSHVN